MRVGIRLGAERASAVAVEAGGRRRTARVRGRDAISMLGELLSELELTAGVVTSVVVELTEALSAIPIAPVVSIRVTPRALPMAPAAIPTLGLRATTFTVRGGHDALGRELVGLDEATAAELAAGIEPGSLLAVTAVGSLGRADHERRIGEIVRAGASLGGVVESNAFYAESFRVREHTAVAAAALRSGAEHLALRLAESLERSTPGARQYFMTNDGGCAPLSRLPMLAVHALRAVDAAEMLGAAARCGRRDGRIVLLDAAGARFADLVGGQLSARATTMLDDGTRLASSSPHLVEIDDPLFAGSLEPDDVVQAGSAPSSARFPLAPTAVVDGDLAAEGAAAAAIVSWGNRMAVVRSAEDIATALERCERSARSALVAAGADPRGVRIAEARVLSSTYGLQETVRLRVRAVADTPVDPLMGGGGSA